MRSLRGGRVPAIGRPAGRGGPLRDHDARLLVAGGFVASLGYGLYTTGSLLFYTRVVGLSAQEVGLGLSVAGAAAIVSAPFVGQWADRLTARRACILIGIAQALLLASAVLVTSFGWFVLVISLLGVAENGGAVARQALVADVASPTERVRLAALLRSSFTLGLTVGLAVAGAGIAFDSAAVYTTIILVNGATALVAVGLTVFVSSEGKVATPAPAAAVLGALRDVPYVAVAMLSGLIGIVDTIIAVGVPLWIIDRTEVPRPFASWILILNAALVVVMQVPLARWIRDAKTARRALVCAALAGAAGLGPLALTRSTPTGLALSALALSVALLTGASLLGAGSSWALRYGLAPEGSQGLYGGVFSTAVSVKALVGPAIVTFAVTHNLSGGLLLVVGYLGLAGLSGPVVRWGYRSRSRYVEGSHLVSS
jgi:hypothetical protein